MEQPALLLQPPGRGEGVRPGPHCWEAGLQALRCLPRPSSPRATVPLQQDGELRFCRPENYTGTAWHRLGSTR